ncbi:hypothetical protein I5G63_gp085 [Mycobacterium phage Imvubu]|uniref:Uncharacterized protein n=1 Tax=Mycobacterium phage Imvubu TaxID=2686233 RepID=A0A6B9LFX5_9CAUD|nr:hypothetical protein I5G63_gp085 [Mycobacterium phage Imvubu]QHB37825.1 hypothetical protein PBI_IMVUBU_85 [Mycobacterium phage Imvubu]
MMPGLRCGVCEGQADLLALFGEEGDPASLEAIAHWHDDQHAGNGPFDPREPGEGWAGKTTQADTITAAELEVHPGEVVCLDCFLVHRPGVCDR